MQRFFQSAGILIITLALTSCAAINFAYNNAPGFVASEFEDAFDLDQDQADQLDVALQDFFAWHRQNELPHYRQLLERAARDIEDGITAAEFLRINSDFRNAWQRSLARIIDDIGDLATTLTPQQIEHYAEYYEDDSENYRDYLEMSAQQREIFRVDRGFKRLQDWFGSFDEFQSERIRNKLRQLPEMRSAWIGYRQARQQALLRALRASSSEGLTRARLKFILLDPASEHAQAIEPIRRGYWQAYANTIEAISKDLSKAQLQHAVERLHYYTEIVDGLLQPE
jgi:hypothetical protein